MPSEGSSLFESTPGFTSDILPSDMDYEFSKDDMLEQFNADFDMLLPGNDALDSSFFDKLMEDDPLFQWPELPLKSESDYNFSETDLTDKPLKLSPAPSPRSSTSSESSNSVEKFMLETPPVSPQFPETVPQSTMSRQDKKQTVLKINPKNIKIIQNVKGLKPVGRQTQIVLPKEVLEKLKNLKSETDVTESTNIIPIHPISNPTVVQQINYQKPLVIPSSHLSQSTHLLGQTVKNNIPYVNNSNPTILPFIKQEPECTKRVDINIRALKRQQRMIKNRESACLSRKKKKEYVTSLESKLSELEEENSKLKMENEVLRARIKDLESNYGETGKAPSAFFNNNFRKTTAVFAVLIMVSLNLGSLSILSRDRVPDEFKQGSTSNGDWRQGRSLLWAFTDIQDEPQNSNSSISPTCPLYINQTESLRLEEELRRWIGVDVGRGNYKNNSRDSTKLKPTFKNIMLHHPQKYKSFKVQKMQRKAVNALDVYRSPFPGSLPRRDDTFYVFSFSSDHLLIPAVAHNNTLRPKMSFVIPTIPLNESVIMNGTIPMMQIDCEVLATRSIEFTEKDFKIFKHNKEEQRKNNNTAEVTVRSPPLRPYFMQRRRPKQDSEYDANFDPYQRRHFRTSTFP